MGYLSPDQSGHLVPHMVAAFDKFKATATAVDLCDAAATMARAGGWSATVLPLADGGEGSIGVLGGPNKHTTVTGPLGSSVEAGWRLEGKTAFIEMAEASGLGLAGGPANNRPLEASTRGTGELIAHAMKLGATKIYVFVGGSATTDGGWGAVEAIVAPSRLRGIELVVATDVRTRFMDAAKVFGPQKGASPTQVRFLTRRLESVASLYHDRYGVDVTEVEGGGAAGGLAGGLLAVGGRIESGFEVIADHIQLDQKLDQASLVVTGEGRLDAESFNGKVVGGVVSWASSCGVPVLVIVGSQDPDFEPPHGLEVVKLDELYGTDRSMQSPCSLVAEVVRKRLALV